MTEVTRRDAVIGALAAPAAFAAPAAAAPFRPDWESLAAGYRCPDWFRDAKLGIWSHWGPQCVPEFGDWYGRLMYVQGHAAHARHVATFGHPSRTGFMEVIGSWRAPAFDPEALLDRFVAAGAKYVVSMANHHDNLDLFDSAHHAWNSVRVGPRIDIVGAWERAARRRGLRFGVSNHAAHAWHWQQAAYSYDAEGPLAGVRYDAFRLRKEDGAGTWWEGLDPQELYTGPSMVAPDGLASIAAMNAWRDANDGQWIETVPPTNPAFAARWALRQRDLVDKYKPDLVYFDNYGLPLEQYGLEATAYLYNETRARTGELPVVNGKRLEPWRRRAIVESVERGFSDTLREEPWQTDTCIGDWHYNRARFEDRSYVPAKAVLQRLVDVVSKNGTMLLSIPQRGDGSIDAEEEKILDDMAAWMRVNGGAIFGSRPWRVFGEGPTRVPEGNQSEGAASGWTEADIRFTTQGRTLYAFALDAPTRPISIGALAGMADRIEAVELLGYGPVAFTARAEGLSVAVPRTQLPAPFCLRIEGRGLA